MMTMINIMMLTLNSRPVSMAVDSYLVPCLSAVALHERTAIMRKSQFIVFFAY